MKNNYISGTYYRNLDGDTNVLGIEMQPNPEVKSFFNTSAGGYRTTITMFNLSDEDLGQILCAVKDALKQRGVEIRDYHEGYEAGASWGRSEGYRLGKRDAFQQASQQMAEEAQA